MPTQHHRNCGSAVYWFWSNAQTNSRFASISLVNEFETKPGGVIFKKNSPFNNQWQNSTDNLISLVKSQCLHVSVWEKSDQLWGNEMPNIVIFLLFVIGHLKKP